MKYLLLSILALAGCALVGFIPAFIIKKVRKTKTSTTVILNIIFSILIVSGIALGYLCSYYKADLTGVNHPSNVTMEKIDGGYFFDGPGEDTAFIFYPGAKVDTLAYAPLMESLAENGIDCFLADMPFHLAIFDSSRGEKFLNNYSYTNWAAGGHSMGGVSASMLAANHPDKINTIILLASYPNNDIPDSIKLVSIYGTEDQVLGKEAYENSREYWPANFTEHIIEGGNHGQFGFYGIQSGDGNAAISREKQQHETVCYIMDAIN